MAVSPLKVRRPGNTRGPLEDQGRNQGLGVPDVADRSNQGNAGSGLLDRPEPRAAKGPVAPVSPGGDRVQTPAKPTRPVRPANEPLAGGGTLSPEQIQRDLDKINEGDDPPPFNEADSLLGGGPNGRGKQAEEAQQQQDTLAGMNVDQVLRMLDSIPDTGLSSIIGEDGTPSINLPQFAGSTVYFDPKLQQYAVQGVQVDQTFLDSIFGQGAVFSPSTQGLYVLGDDGQWRHSRTGQAAPSELASALNNQDVLAYPADSKTQGTAQAVNQLIADAEAARSSEDAEMRQFFIGEVRAQLEAIRAQSAADTQNEFTAGEQDERLANDLLLTTLNNAAENQRAEADRAFSAHQNGLDRALQAAQYDRENAISQGNLDLARQRLQQETQLSNAQLALSLLQTFSSSPETLYALQNSGLLQQFQQLLPGLNFSFLPGANGQAAQSNLGSSELPSLAQLQSMPADQQQNVLTMLAVQTGVSRDILVAEIQRRASGMGLAGGNQQIQRVPA